MNSMAIKMLPDAMLSYLPRTTSNHAPMLIELKPHDPRYGPSSFKFQQMWVSHEGFKDMVKAVWQEQSMESGLTHLAKKLKKLKLALKDWNVQVFGRIEEQIKSLEWWIKVLSIVFGYCGG